MMFGTTGLDRPLAPTGISYVRPGRNQTERQKLLVGTVALVLGVVSVATLATNGVGDTASAMALGVASVAFLVVGTLSIGTSEGVRV